MVILGGWVFLMIEVPLYMGTSLRRNRSPLSRTTIGPYLVPTIGSYEGGFLMGEAPLESVLSKVYTYGDILQA